ncbi:hypothetical protein [Paenibacillus sp. GXUN7292]|uniref:hypothetical protein n=1 Tax=Paenibacillus sp. GXUN7292 TaxID=3422499 RepID=UPI003D7D252A
MNHTEWNELVQEVELHIIKLEQASLSVGELFYDSIEPKTLEVFSQYLKGFYDISHAIAVTVENGESFIPSLKEKTEQHVNELFNQFEQMKLLLNQERFVSLADIMKYEIPSHLQKILVVLKE